MIRTAMILVAAAFGGCVGEHERSLQFRESGVVERDWDLGQSLPERFSGDDAETENSSGSSGQSILAWDTPEGWIEKPLTQYRLGSFEIPADGDCSISKIGGSLVQNVNRWRAQFGLEAVGMSEVASLPKKKVGPGEGFLVEFEGSYTGMGGNKIEKAKLCGIVVPVNEGLSLFLKFVGPVETVDANREKFFALAASLRAEGGATAPESGGGPVGPVSTGGFDAARLQWTLPDGWSRRQSSSSMRIVSAGPDAHPQAQAWVIALPGEAGGLVNNINRWRGEIGAQQLTETQIAALPRLRVLDTDAVMVEAYGDYQGQDGSKAASGMFGVIAMLGDHAVFVKMVGPADAMKTQRPQFLAFAESLELR